MTDAEKYALAANEYADPRSETQLRTGFIVSDRQALTAWHCIRDIGGTDSRVWLRLRRAATAGGYLYAPLRHEQHDAVLDLAVLGLDDIRIERAGMNVGAVREILARRAFRLSTIVQSGDDVTVEGFPTSCPNPDGKRISGRVRDHAAPFGQIEVLQLYIEDLAAAAPDHPGGLSGGPVVCLMDGSPVVVGVVRAYPRDHVPSIVGPDASAEKDGPKSEYRIAPRRATTGGALIATRMVDAAKAMPTIAGVLEERTGDGLPSQAPDGKLQVRLSNSDHLVRKRLERLAYIRDQISSDRANYYEEAIVVNYLFDDEAEGS